MGSLCPSTDKTLEMLLAATDCNILFILQFMALLLLREEF